jgi:hypothetical protein
MKLVLLISDGAISKSYMIKGGMTSLGTFFMDINANLGKKRVSKGSVTLTEVKSNFFKKWFVRQSADRQSTDTITVNRQSTERQSAERQSAERQSADTTIRRHFPYTVSGTIRP